MYEKVEIRKPTFTGYLIHNEIVSMKDELAELDQAIESIERDTVASKLLGKARAELKVKLQRALDKRYGEVTP